MMEDDEVSNASYSGDDAEAYKQRRTILYQAITSVIAALGGIEGQRYVLGDEAYGCLKDLKKFWRKDDTDDERTVARIFWKTRVLPNDLVPIILETAGNGQVTHKCAVACADLVTAMTWPIDLAEELKELDEELDRGTDFTQLMNSHLHYKAALLAPGVLKALLAIMVPCLAKQKHERTERDGQIINVVLYLFRNLAFIKDQPHDMSASAAQAEFSSLQSKLITTLEEIHALDLLLTIASNAATDPFFNQWNALVMETFYLLFRGVKPASLAVDQKQRPHNALSQMLEAENKVRREAARRASSRHSRFGTTISVRLNSAKQNANANNRSQDSTEVTVDPSEQAFILHRQQALGKESGTILDMKKRKLAKKSKKIDDLAQEDNLSSDAMVILQKLAKTLVVTCFNPFLSSLLKDIKSERPKITEKDNLRLLFVTKWLLEFFLAVQGQQKTNASMSAANADTWDFALVAEVVEKGWIVWVLRRMREAMEEKPKLWTELQAGIECLTQFMLLIDSMQQSQIEDTELAEAAELLQQQVVYNGEVLDIAVDSLRFYKEGVQSLTYLDSSVHLSYSILRMLERWAKAKGGGDVYVRKRAKPKRKRKNKDTGAIEEVDDEQEQAEAQANEEDIIQETMFSFEAFEAKFVNEDIAHTLITYLARFEEFKAPEQMKRVVNLLHRQVVKVKAEGLLFKVSALRLFKDILSKQRMLPTDQPYKDLIALITYILKKFFKAVSEEPLTIVEAFYPKSRGRWKQFSSWEPEAREKSQRGALEVSGPVEVRVKRGYSWSEQMGIVIACLVEAGQKGLVDWTKQILSLVIGIRQRVVDETDGSSSQSQLDDNMDDDEVREAAARLRGPSNEAMSKFEDYLIPYVTDDEAQAATKNATLKLLFKLSNFKIIDDNADELEWYIPAAILPSDLQQCLNVINQFLETPFSVEGKKAAQLLSKKSQRRRRQRSPSPIAHSSDEDEEAPKRKAKKKKEKEVYKSAQFIEDSDAELGDEEEFWANERAQREKTALLAAEGKSAGMHATGTKKRKNKTTTSEKKGKRRRKSVEKDKSDSTEESTKSDAEDGFGDVFDAPKDRGEESSPATTPPITQAPATRRRPKPAYTGRESSQEKAVAGSTVDDLDLSDDEYPTQTQKRKGRMNIVVSDEEDE